MFKNISTTKTTFWTRWSKRSTPKQPCLELKFSVKEMILKMVYPSLKTSYTLHKLQFMISSVIAVTWTVLLMKFSTHLWTHSMEMLTNSEPNKLLLKILSAKHKTLLTWTMKPSETPWPKRKQPSWQLLTYFCPEAPTSWVNSTTPSLKCEYKSEKHLGYE